MAKITLIYGSTSGNTETVAHRIQTAWGKPFDQFINVARAKPAHLREADYLILGTPTWNDGALQEDWASFLPLLKTVDLTGKHAALFGLGDAQSFSGMFVNGLRELHDAVEACGAAVAGKTPATGYDFEFSAAADGGRFLGLVIDQENQSELTQERVATWVGQLRDEWNLPAHSDKGCYGDKEHCP